MAAEKYRVIARSIILTADRRLVLVSSHTGQALVLPGGAVDRGETLAEAAAREAREESGLAITLGPAIWVREFYSRQHAQANLEVYFLAQPAAPVPDRWQREDGGKPGLLRQVALYSRDELRASPLAVYPAELRDAFWDQLQAGFHQGYLGRFEG